MTKRIELEAILERLERENGKIRAEDLVAEAEHPDSPIHDMFEWNDRKAGHAFRIVQARHIISGVRIERSVRSVTVTVPAYVRDPDSPADEQGYRSLVNIKSDEDRARGVLIDEMKRVGAAVRRAKNLAAVLGVEADVATIESIAEAITSRISSAEEAHA